MEHGPISGGLRRAIFAAMREGETMDSIAKRADIATSAVSRFLAGKSITTTTADRIAKALGIELTRKAKRTRARQRRTEA